ncbi:MAG: Unknown protein [uncultured Sulfurovum sp.]|uniref:Mechanosensitive ion channel n=1 Tax=uncultured Sulfurovum sp. TaxID=269237 RepID=A0A6S6SN75_9BACT|nr:MAG: Unknown protein [uncultured Sulfurovum sp.]
MFKNLLLSLTLLLFLSGKTFANESSIFMLNDLEISKQNLEKELKDTQLELKKSLSEDEKTVLKGSIKNLNEQINGLETKFSKIATGIDVTMIQKDQTQTDNSTLSEDIQQLLKPLIQSARDSTKGLRDKAYLQEEINHYKLVLPKATEAYDNVKNLLPLSTDKAVTQELKELESYWQQQVQLLSSQLNASLHQVEVLEKNDVSFSSSFQDNTKKFFHERGLVLFKGLMGTIIVLMVMKLLYFVMTKIFPVFKRSSRSFYIRLVDLFFRVLTVLLAVIVPMAIFYIEEDSLLFSLGLLVFIGVLWGFRNLLAKLWQQGRLFLNIGPVREEERIFFEGLPWQVKTISIFTVLHNPASGMNLRVPIEKLVGLNSRPSHPLEPWFPCKIDDWLILSDDYYGKVKGLSLEFIELEDLGGGKKTYLISDFLALSPLNLSTDFRVVEVFGISYRHQKESTTKVVELLEAFLLKKIEEEDYADGLKKLLVQFNNAADSSLNLKIVANFSGEMAPLYFRLHRAIQRWCVDACNEYDWEIPFPQLTMHQA